jgi:hypothetical protein
MEPQLVRALTKLVEPELQLSVESKLWKGNTDGKVDLHGKSVQEAEQIIDGLAVKGGLWEVVTGHGTGALKALLKQLQKVYDFKVLMVAPNQASFVLDFG